MKSFLWPLVYLCTLLASAQEVTLSLDDYEALLARTKPDASQSEPIPAALETAHMIVTLSAHGAVIQAKLNVVVSKGPRHRIDIGSWGKITSLDLGDLEGMLLDDEEDGFLTLLVSGDGRYQVTLESVFPFDSEAGSTMLIGKADLPLPPAVAVQGEVRFDHEKHRLIMNEYFVREKLEEGHFAWVANPGTQLNLTLRHRETFAQREDMATRFDTAVDSLIQVSREKTIMAATLSYYVRQGAVDALQVDLPEGFVVLGAKTADEDVVWTMNGRRMDVTLPESVSQDFKLQLQLERPSSDTFTTPVIHTRGAEQSRHTVGMNSLDNGLFVLLDEGSAETEPSPGAVFRNFRGQIFKILDPKTPPRWEVFWGGDTEALAGQIKRMFYTVSVGTRGKAHFELWCIFENRGMPHLDLTLPTQSELISVTWDGHPISPSWRDGSLRFSAPVSKKEQVLYIRGLTQLALPEESTEFELPLPAANVPIRAVEVQSWFNDGERYQLVDSFSQSGVGVPPNIPFERGGHNPFSNQFNVSKTYSYHIPEPMRGAAVVQAAWISVSPTPNPLKIKRIKKRVKKEWL